MSLQDKWAFVTGASSGFGKAIAKDLAGQGCKLVILARREDRLQALKQELDTEVIARRLDVRDRDAVRETIETLHSENVIPDILINNAGLASGKDAVYNADFEDWDKMIDTNVKGLLNITRYVIPHMMKRNQGHIVNIGSTAGHQTYPGGSVYNATKFAVKALNEAINLDLKGTDIRVCSIDPGMADTEFSEVRFHGDKEQAADVYKGFEPLHAEDIASAVSYVLNTPKHVNIQNMVIYPTAQRNVYNLAKSSSD